MNNFKISKKIMSAAIASLLVAGSIGGAAFAAQNSDIVKKDVLMTESAESNGDKDYFDKTNISAKVKENEAVNIAKNALKNIFDIEIKDEYTMQANYFDKSKNDASYEGRSIWVVSWKTQPNTSIGSSSVFVDAETGEVLSMASKRSNVAEVTEALSKDDAETKVAEFIQSKNLNNGASIKEIETTTSSKRIIEAKVKLDNGKEMTVIISCATNEIVVWQNHI